MEQGPAITRRAFLAAIAATSTLALAACEPAVPDTIDSASEDSPADSSSGEVLSQALDNGFSSGTHHVTIEVSGYGSMDVELYADSAPITVSNFCDLVQRGFYDGLTFHRVVSGFMIQGGDPNGDGTRGSGRRLKGEFTANGSANPLLHQRGVISMARATDYDSASSQFFIMQQQDTDLDGTYAAFGSVTSGMEVVDAICSKVRPQDSSGLVARADQPVITKIALVD